MRRQLDAVYIAASAHDGRFTRLCVASVRACYPNAPIRILAGGQLEPGLINELEWHWDVQLADLPRDDWGWGFIKLEPLFGPPGERFLVLDSDTVFAGPVLKTCFTCKAPFLVDDEQQSEEDTHRLYYNWRKVAAVDPAARPPQFVFNSGQWFGTAGVLTRSDFKPFINWSCMPPRLRFPNLFMNGEQGILNYILNQKAQLDGLQVERRPIMRWPGHGMHDITAATVASGSAPARIVHWAGFKGPRLASLPGSDVLHLFEQAYYDRLPMGQLRRQVAALRHPCVYWWRALQQRFHSRLGMVVRR